MSDAPEKLKITDTSGRIGDFSKSRSRLYPVFCLWFVTEARNRFFFCRLPTVWMDAMCFFAGNFQISFSFRTFARLYTPILKFMDKLIETIVSAIEDKKGKNIVSLDLSGFDGAICSHFVVCNADSTTQVAAIADGIEEKVLETLGEKVWRIEGQQNAVWIAMDYVDVVVHIFQTELRSFYKLEELWADAPMVKYEYEA